MDHLCTRSDFTSILNDCILTNEDYTKIGANDNILFNNILDHYNYEL